MFNKCVVFTAAILLLSSACFASIGQAQSCVVAPGKLGGQRWLRWLRGRLQHGYNFSLPNGKFLLW
jgi:hypothetical protein